MATRADLADFQMRHHEVVGRHQQLKAEREMLLAGRQELAVNNRLSRRLDAFGRRVCHGIDSLDFEQRQKLVRLLVEQVRVTGPAVEIPFFSFSEALTIPLEAPLLSSDGEALERWPALAPLLPNAAAEQLQHDSYETQLHVFRAVTAFFHAVAETTPLILLLDDLHRAEPRACRCCCT